MLHDEHFGENYRRYSDVMITSSLEERERLRRLVDAEEEMVRKENAKKVSRILHEKNSTFISDFVSAHSGKGLYKRGAEYASSLLHASSDVTHAAFEAGQKGIETTQQVAQDVVSKASEIAYQGAELAQSVVESSGVVGLIRSALGKVADLWDDLSETITWARVVEIEETERERRLSSNSEARAVMNAQRVSSLIKDLGRPFYRPESEPSINYGTQLLEDLERNRRIWEDSTGHVAIVNAQGVAEIVKDSVRLLKTSGHLNIPDIQKGPFPVESSTIQASAVSQ